MAHFNLKGESTQDIITHQVFDAQGHMSAEQDSLGHYVSYSYDANGQVTRSWQDLKQADGTTQSKDVRYSYDKSGHLLSTSTFKNNAAVQEQEARYNIFGELTQKGINGESLY